jgi:hypothetical protein
VGEVIKSLISTIKILPNMGDQEKADLIFPLKQTPIKARDGSDLCGSLDSISKMVKSLEHAHFISSDRAASIEQRITGAEKSFTVC